MANDLILPAGMNSDQFRQHPIAEILRDASHGNHGLPSQEELDALNLPPDALSELRRECVHLAELVEGGDRQTAFRKWREVAVGLLNRLPGEYRHLEPASQDGDTLEETNPDVLAAQIPDPFRPF